MTAIYYDTNGGGLSNTEIDSNFRTCNWIKGDEQPAASALTLPAEANYFVVTGNTDITSITNVDGGDGVYGYVCRLKFSGTPSLIHGAGLQCMFADDMQMAAGDVVTLVNESNNVWRVTSYAPADSLGNVVVDTLACTQITSGTIGSDVTASTQASNEPTGIKIATTGYADNAAGNNNIFVNKADGRPVMQMAGTTGGYEVSADTQNTWFTYGAIGSGAQKESNVFSDLTTDHDWIELKILLYGLNNTGSTLDLRLYGGDDGVSVTPTGGYDWYIAHLRQTISGGGAASQRILTTHKVPCSNGRFSMRWTDNAASDRSFVVFPIGVGVNGS